MLSYLQAIVIALVQGVTELLPVSSLGHSVLVPAWIGGSWETLVTQSSGPHSESSFYLAFIVALHVATALALLWLFRADWIRIIAGFLPTVRRAFSGEGVGPRDFDEGLSRLIILATIPVGITGLALEHVFRIAFAKPVAASVFLFINGLILLTGDHIHGQVAVGFVICGVTAYFSAKYLLRYFETRSIRPFAIYRLVAGAISAVRFGLF